MTEPKKIEVQIDQYTSEIAYYRGLFIEIAIQIELAMNEVIALHYCGKNDTLRAEFTALFLSKEGFRLASKKEVFHYILHTHYQEYYLSNELLSRDTLDNINNIRNSYAHDIALINVVENELKIELVKVAMSEKSNNKNKARTEKRLPKVKTTVKGGSGDVHLGAVYLAQECLKAIKAFNKDVLNIQ